MGILLRSLLVIALACGMALTGCSDDGGETSPVVLQPDVGDMEPDVGDMEPDVGDMEPDVDDPEPDADDMPDGEDEPVLDSLAIDPAEFSLGLEETQALTLNGTFDDGSTEVISEGVAWASSDEDVATVDVTGVVTAVSAGTATITATVGDLSATAAATVDDAPPAPPGLVFGDDFGPGLTFQAFGGSNNDLSIDVNMPGEGAASLSVAVPAESYTGGAFKAPMPTDLSGFNALQFMARASEAKTLNVTGIGNNAASTTHQVELAAVALTPEWATFTIPIPNPARLTAEDGFFHFAEGSDEGAYTIWFDDIRYVSLSDEELGTLMPAIATETRQVSVGDSFVVPGTSVTIMRDDVPSVYATAPSYFDFLSSNEDVATVGADGTVTIVGDGSAAITATLAGQSVVGEIALEAGQAVVLDEPAPTPQEDPADVISLFSDAFMNSPVDTFSAVWDDADVEDFNLGDDNIKQYSNLVFAGIEFTSTPVDASEMTHFRMDIWSPNAASFNIKLVDFGGDGVFGGGDDSEHELAFTADTDPAIVTGQWISFDIPLEDFVNMTGRSNIAQLIVVSSNSTVFIDNIYFRQDDGGGEPPEEEGFQVFGDDFEPGVSFAEFGGSTNELVIDDTLPGEGATSLAITVPDAGYTGGALKADAPADLSGFNALRFMARASEAKTLNVAGFGNNAASSVFQVELGGIALTPEWATFTIPIPNPARLTAEDGFFHFAEGSDEGSYTIWFDDIRFVNLSDQELGTLMPAMATETRQVLVGDSFTVPGTSVVIMRGDVPSVYATAPSYFDFLSSDEDVATVEPNGTVNIGGVGTAVITATMNGLSVNGSITAEAGLAMVPVESAPAPQEDPADVISLFSDAFMNSPVDTFSAVWDSADVEDFNLGDDNIKQYSNLAFAGIEFTSTPVDAGEMTHFRMDIWSPNAASFNIKLVDFGGDGVFGGGDDSEQELAFTADTDPAIVTGQWISFDIPLDDFVNMTGRSNIAQLIVVSSNSTVFIDNIYFRR